MKNGFKKNGKNGFKGILKIKERLIEADSGSLREVGEDYDLHNLERADLTP